jgi:hypothetical protein
MLHNMNERVGWGTVVLLPVTPPSDLAEDDVLGVGKRQYWECGYSGWHLMLGWLAGPETLMRAPDNRDHYWDVEEQTSSGSRTLRMAMSPDDQRELEDDRNDYLREVGLPADRPHGYRWFQVLPDGLTAGDVHRVPMTYWSHPVGRRWAICAGRCRWSGRRFGSSTEDPAVRARTIHHGGRR